MLWISQWFLVFQLKFSLEQEIYHTIQAITMYLNHLQLFKVSYASKSSKNTSRYLAISNDLSKDYISWRLRLPNIIESKQKRLRLLGRLFSWDKVHLLIFVSCKTNQRRMDLNLYCWLLWKTMDHFHSYIISKICCLKENTYSLFSPYHFVFKEKQWKTFFPWLVHFSELQRRTSLSLINKILDMLSFHYPMEVGVFLFSSWEVFIK